MYEYIFRIEYNYLKYIILAVIKYFIILMLLLIKYYPPFKERVQEGGSVYLIRSPLGLIFPSCSIKR